MQRKLVKQGRNALTVTLPAKWLKEKGLKSGDYVDIEEQENALTISADAKNLGEEIELDLRDKEPGFFYHQLIAKYLEGYDKIRVLHNNSELMQEGAQSLLGMILERFTNHSAVLRNIILVPEDNFNKVLRRAAFMLSEHAKQLKELHNKSITFAQLRKNEQLLDLNLRYCMRYLNKYGRDKESYKYLLLCETLESAGDMITEIGKVMGIDNKLIDRIIRLIEDYTECIFSENFSKAYSSIRSFRAQLNKKTFADGLCYSLQEMLYDNIGYLIKEKN